VDGDAVGTAEGASEGLQVVGAAEGARVCGLEVAGDTVGPMVCGLVVAGALVVGSIVDI